MQPRSFFFASGNKGKLAEVREIADRFNVKISSPLEVLAKAPELGAYCDPEESAGSYIGNAKIKAMAGLNWSGMPTIADDTGLEVVALGGRPGVSSARYAGERATSAENIQKLLSEMTGQSDRRASFYCLIYLAVEAAENRIFEGRLHGSIAHSPSGAGGFGYDSVFIVDGFGRSLADLKGAGVKVKTHRATALEALFNSFSADGEPRKAR